MTTLRNRFVRAACCAITVACLAAVGCNTVKGVGKDIQGAGEAGEDLISGDG